MTGNDMVCPHCNETLTRWEPCPETGWDTDLYYCDNNECRYFVDGRRKICEEFQKNFAYRFCYNPKNGQGFPLIAWCGGELSLLRGRCDENLQGQCQPERAAAGS